MLRASAIVAALALAGTLSSCSRREMCLAGTESCERAALCERLSYDCGGDSLYVGPLADLPGGLDLTAGEGTGRDWALQNGRVTLVLDALGEPHGLAPTGGTVLDFGPRGGVDAINSIYQLSGILPDDAFAYDSIQIVDRRPELVAIVVRGALDGRGDVPVVTRYELRPCEPGVRVRTELLNGSPDVHTVVIADAAHWGKRNALPFAPKPDQGFWQPGLDLLEIAEDWDSYAYVAARPASDAATTYGFVSCDRAELRGVNDVEVSALGTDLTLLRPGEELSYQRFLVAESGDDLERGVRRIAEARGQLHGDPAPVTVRGRIVAGGFPVAGSVRRAVVVLSEVVGDDLRRPLTTVVPGQDGRFAASVPTTSWLWYDVWSFGRIVARGVVPRSSASDLGDIAIPEPATLSIAVTIEGEPAHATVTVHPADVSTRAQVIGSWFGRFGSCAPWLGPPVGGSPACNKVIVPPEGIDVELPAGRYELWALAGPERSIGKADVSAEAGEIAALEIDLGALDVVPDGWLGADLHVHGAGSFDSSLPDLDRAATFVAHGVEVIAATDHDHVTDYAAAVDELAVGDRVQVIGGLETTQLIPWLDVPGEDLPRVIGHFNHWPIPVAPGAPRGGAPWDERVEPGELFDRLDPLVGADGVHMLNHPWDETQFGRDLGYLRAIGFDPRVPIPDDDDGTKNGMLMRAPAGGRRNIDFDTVEVQNGAHLVQVVKTRPLWFSLLSQGFVRAGVGSSDSHSLVDNQLGFARTWVEVGSELADFDVATFNRALIGGRAVAGNGVFIDVAIQRASGENRGLGFAPLVPASGDAVDIEVRAAPWIPVDEVRVVTSGGTRILASGEELDHPEDRLGVDGVVRWSASLPIAELVDADRDDWFLIEAGMPFFATADLDDSGVPDTSDNNRDGVVDEKDIEDEDDDSGPLESPPDPTDPADPRYVLTRVLEKSWPYGFTNPILVDWGGDGWTAPGIAP